MTKIEHCGNVNYIHESHDWIDPSNFLSRRCSGTRPEPIDGPHAFQPHWSHECTAWVVRNGEDDSCCARPGDPIHTAQPTAPRDEARAALAEMASTAPLTEQLIADGERLHQERDRARVEVHRLREEVRIEREAEERANAELKDIVRRLDEAEVDSGGVSERVGYVIQSMQRAWAQATDGLARLDTVKADRETACASLDHLKKSVIRPARKMLAVEHAEDIVPAIERLVDALVRAEAQSAADPQVLSLPQVPPGTVALVFKQPPAREIRFTLTEGPLPWRMVDDAGESHYWALLDLLAHFGPVTVVKREPRTDAELLAMVFHETYERLAPEHGYETREASAKPWDDVPANNRALMCAVAAELIARFDIFMPVEGFDDEPGGES